MVDSMINLKFTFIRKYTNLNISPDKLNVTSK